MRCPCSCSLIVFLCVPRKRLIMTRFGSDTATMPLKVLHLDLFHSFTAHVVIPRIRAQWHMSRDDRVTVGASHNHICSVNVHVPYIGERWHFNSEGGKRASFLSGIVKHRQDVLVRSYVGAIIYDVGS